MEKEPIHISTIIVQIFELINDNIMVKDEIDFSSLGKTENQGFDRFKLPSEREERKPKKKRLKRGFDYQVDENGNVWENPNVITIGLSINQL